MSIIIDNNCTDIIYEGKPTDIVYLGGTECWRKDKVSCYLTTGPYVNTAINRDAPSFVKVTAAPDVSITTTDISRDRDGSIVTWYDNVTTTQYWYCASDIVYLNADSSGIFCNCMFTIDPSLFKWDNVEAMDYAFGGCKGQNLDFSGCNLHNVKNMAAAFDGFNNEKKEVFTIDLSNNDMPNLESMYCSFGHTYKLNVKLPKSTSKLTNTSYMFSISSDITIDFGQFDTSRVTTMEQMFLEFASTTKRDNFTPILNTSSVENFKDMFNGIGSYVKVLDLSSFDISSATDMTCFIYDSHDIESVIWGDHFIPSNEFISKCLTTNRTSSEETFNPTVDMLQINIDWDTNEFLSPPPDWSNFNGKWLVSGVFLLDISGHLAPGSVINAAINKNATSFVYQDNNYYNYQTKTDISLNGDWSAFTWYDESDSTQYWYCANDVMTLNPDSSGMFAGCSKLKKIKFNYYSFTITDTGKVENFQNIFNGCSALTEISYGTKFVLPESVLNNCTTTDESNKTYMAFNQCPANKPEWTGGTWNTDGTFVKSV